MSDEKQQYAVEVTISGRVTIVVEATSPEEAESLVFDSPDYPNLDNVYDSNESATVI